MKKLIFLLLTLVATGFTIKAQTVRVVDNNINAPIGVYTTLSAAESDAIAGDIILVQPSPTMYTSVSITKQLFIYGIAPNPELNAGLNAHVNQIIFNSGNCSGSKISGLEINSIVLSFSSPTANNIIITNNMIGEITGNAVAGKASDVVIQGNYFNNTANFYNIEVNASLNWVITNNTFERTGSNPLSHIFSKLNATTMLNNNIILSRQDGDGSNDISIFNDSHDTIIANNIFIFTGTNVDNFTTLATVPNTALTFLNNLTFSVNPPLLDLLGAPNIDNTDPLFDAFNAANPLNDLTNDFHFLTTSSPAEGAGSDGKDLGVYNNPMPTFPFDMRGYPTELPYLTEVIINNSTISVDAPLDVQVKADANQQNNP